MTGAGGVHDGPDELVLRAAWLYHVDGMTQAEVASSLHVSRPTVGRFLERARDRGFVRTEVSAEHLASFGLAARVKDEWGLDDCVVVPRSSLRIDDGHRNARLASAAATFIRRFLHPETVVGVAWGDAVQRTLSALPPAALDGVTLATLSGGIEHITQRILSTPALTARLRAVPAPLIVSRPEVAEALREEASVKEVLTLAQGANITLTGIGTALPGSSAARSGMLSDQQVSQFAASGAVGDMVGEFFTATGEVLPATSDRRIGVTLEQMRDMPHVVGVAGGVDKANAIRGALSGHYLNVLVTDEEAAEGLVKSAG
ncbi:sugar-binding transcriptional regulator [Demequina sp.]|uniref:sugar-binding transcriptional regulator n=1 Tax=Demequina sp. TaxID=2050685 RepID=UPI003A8553AE